MAIKKVDNKNVENKVEVETPVVETENLEVNVEATPVVETPVVEVEAPVEEAKPIIKFKLKIMQKVCADNKHRLHRMLRLRELALEYVLEALSIFHQLL